jgi:hypothetical protein
MDALFREMCNLFDYRDDPEDDLLDFVVYRLMAANAEITCIQADQWMAISTEAVDGFKTWIQCDRTMYGLAATLMAYYTEYGQEFLDGKL